MGTKSKSRGSPTSRGTSRRTIDTFERIKGELTVPNREKISGKRGTMAIATSEEELLLITEELHLVSDKTTWMVDSGASYHPIRSASHRTKAGITALKDGK